MTFLFAQDALLPEGWARNVRMGIGDAGLIEEVTPDADPEPGDEHCHVLVPGLSNLHSHAFQRAMAGLAEMRGPAADNFWSWRTEMYRFALEMTPEQLEAVATQLYMEMLESGFTRVGEFHYLHHDRDGQPYGNIAELAERIAAASRAAGISLTLLPVFYAHSDFGGLPPIDGQQRFINSVESFEKLVAASRKLVAAIDGANIGIAPHSLRAATPEEIARILPLAEGGPVHIHAAEQVREVETSLARLGARPIEWLLANMPVDGSWCMIHATHMTDRETIDLAHSGAVAGLCPITEANLGDGIFNAPAFLDAGGVFGIGSDSNILISAAQELRQFEYAQRLGLRARNIVADPYGSTGKRLFETALSGGHKAMGVAGELAVGRAADMVSLSVPEAGHVQRERILDQWIFTGSVGVESVWAHGDKQVEAGRHRDREVISRQFAGAMRAMTA